MSHGSPALLGDDDQVELLAPSKGSRWTCTQGCVRGVRPYLVVLVFVIMAVWTPLEVWRLDGIVPGAKDTYMIEAKLVKGNEKEINEWVYQLQRKHFRSWYLQLSMCQ